MFGISSFNLEAFCTTDSEGGDAGEFKNWRSSDIGNHFWGSAYISKGINSSIFFLFVHSWFRILV
jgi:hypothetical protein